MPRINKSIISIPLSLLIREALRVLSRNKLRSALSAIGITIGIGAVVCVVAIGTAGSKRTEEQLHNLGDNLVWVGKRVHSEASGPYAVHVAGTRLGVTKDTPTR